MLNTQTSIHKTGFRVMAQFDFRMLQQAQQAALCIHSS